MKKDEEFDILIIGAGVNGLSAAYHSSLHSHLKIGILEQFPLGHAHGGSHGNSRIFRSTYSDPAYIKLAQRCRTHEFVQLEQDLGHRFIYPNPACCFGEGATFEKYLHAMAKSDLDIEILDALSARRLYPQFRFSGISHVINDKTGGVIAAKEMIQALTTSIVNRDVKIFENTKLLTIDTKPDLICLNTNQGNMFAKHLIITTGAWIKQLVPSFQRVMVPIQQTVAYFKLEGLPSSYEIPHFPNWAFIGNEPNQIFYGLPSFRSPGIKVSQHITSGTQNDPDLTTMAINRDQLNVLEAFVNTQFRDPIEQILNSETCLYANLPREDFILDLLPTDSRIAVGSVCSGHGFKFAPLTGKLLTELVLNKKTSVAEFEESKSHFSLANLTR